MSALSQCMRMWKVLALSLAGKSRSLVPSKSTEVGPENNVNFPPHPPPTIVHRQHNIAHSLLDEQSARSKHTNSVNMKVESITRSLLHKRYWHIARDISDYNTNPILFIPPPDNDFFPMEHLLKRQARSMILWNERADYFWWKRDQGRETESPKQETSEPNSSKPKSSKKPPKSLTGGLESISMRSSYDSVPTPRGAFVPGPRLSKPGDLAAQQEEGRQLRLLKGRIENVLNYAHKKLYAYKYDQVPLYWKCLYTNALVLMSYYWLMEMVRDYDIGDEADETCLHEHIMFLDKAVISTNVRSLAFDGPRWTKATMECWERIIKEEEKAEMERVGSEEVPKRLFSDEEPFGRPTVQQPVQRLQVVWAVDQFEDYMMDPNKAPSPLIIPDLLTGWGAMNETSWRDVNYLLSQTLGGRRQVPIEIGRSYVDMGWGQDIMSFGKFLDKYVLEGGSEREPGYLAQYELFRQIPRLRNDIQIPDYCWVETPAHPTHIAKDQPKLEEPSLNAWFGPAKTITPLHTDGYHNLLCQVVGTKYVRLYSPHCTEILKPREDEGGVDMSNTSSLDIGVIEGWDERNEDMSEQELKYQREALQDVDYFECILEPGDTLLIPMGWWHYVRSLSVSFSVSFWWN